ncbi:TPR 11 and/or CS domain containing protein [Asbolus verrucosus]|uniref:Dynein axonemal assembly factor 4 n=1 Tax=Asbolus verrucosus TaxID=1661398 RepID=A0A482W2N6_ASBVE|nr:TPR 11 and/or CS domain containing protein [Asbolus verrucosus]
MPIIINKEIEWKQTENTLTIKVPLRGIHSSKTDIFYSRLYLKASFEQYFFEAFLLYPINPKNSTCTFTDSHIVFELVKCESQLWEKLELDVGKAEKQQLKKLYIDEEHNRIREESSEKSNKRSELKRLAVSEQMALDAKQRETIDNIKKEEKTNALKKIDIWKETKQKTVNKSKIKNKQKKEESKLLPPSVPSPRVSRTVTVTFTPREFPTPSRESRLEEETEWLRKQAEARRSVGFISEDIRPEEHNPQFLKAKGDEFLRSRNYLGAVSAYSFGIKLNNKFADLYVARAEAHLALGNYNKTVQDCSRALELMKPEVQLNLRERALCIGRRGISLINLGLLEEGIGELKASLRLVPHEYFSEKLNEAIENLNNVDNSI